MGMFSLENKSFESSKQKFLNESVIARPLNVWTGPLEEDEWFLLFHFYKEVAYICDYF